MFACSIPRCVRAEKRGTNGRKGLAKLPVGTPSALLKRETHIGCIAVYMYTRGSSVPLCCASCTRHHCMSVCPPQRHLQTTTHSRRHVTHSDHYCTQFCFYPPRSWMQVPHHRERTHRFQSQGQRSRAMWPCCDNTSSDDEHNTDNNLLLLFADVDIAPALLAGLSEVDVLQIALGCRLALDMITISQHYCPSPDLEPPPFGAVLEPLLSGMVSLLHYCGHDGLVTCTAQVENNSHSQLRSV